MQSWHQIPTWAPLQSVKNKAKIKISKPATEMCNKQVLCFLICDRHKPNYEYAWKRAKTSTHELPITTKQLKRRGPAYQIPRDNYFFSLWTANLHMQFASTVPTTMTKKNWEVCWYSYLVFHCNVCGQDIVCCPLIRKCNTCNTKQNLLSQLKKKKPQKIFKQWKSLHSV